MQITALKDVYKAVNSMLQAEKTLVLLKQAYVCLPHASHLFSISQISDGRFFGKTMRQKCQTPSPRKVSLKYGSINFQRKFFMSVLLRLVVWPRLFH